MAPARRLEDRIRDLGSRVASARDEELRKILAQLEAAMHEYTRRIDNKASATVLTWPQFPRERRSA